MRKSKDHGYITYTCKKCGEQINKIVAETNNGLCNDCYYDWVVGL